MLIDEFFNVSFKVKLPTDENWTEIVFPLKNLLRQDLVSDEFISEEIKEYIFGSYSGDEFYENQDDLVYEVDNYWKDIVLPIQVALYEDQILKNRI